MKRVAIWLCCTLLPLLFGCVSPQGSVKSAQWRDMTSYTTGEAQTATIGSAMITRGNARFFDRYTCVTDASGLGQSIQAGTSWEALYTFEGQDVLTSVSYGNRGVGIIIDRLGNPIADSPLISSNVLLANPMARPLAGTYRFPCNGCAPGMFKKEDIGYAELGSFKQELIYSGRSGSTISLNYREYKDDFIRPAFFQEARYDLNESDTISFKDFRIKVLKANNNQIDFIVLQ